MHHILAGRCQKFEKFYFFKEIYVISEKLNFQCIMAPERQCTQHHLKKVLKNEWFWLNSTISCAGTVHRCCTIGQSKIFKFSQNFLFLKIFINSENKKFSNFWMNFATCNALWPKTWSKKILSFASKRQKIVGKIFWPPP